jgi:hypothetical protein
MSSQHTTIATRRLTGISPERGELKIEIRIGQPYCTIEGDWACPVAVEGLYPRLADQLGVDSFQALMVAQNFARYLLRDFVAKGGILKGEDGSSDIDVTRLFEGVA